jgi:hypothetical protein
LGKEEDGYPNAAPMWMSLSPRSRYCDQKDVLLIGISKNLLDRVSRTLDSLERSQMEIRGLLESTPGQRFPAIKTNLDILETNLTGFKNNFQERLQTILPKIRGGGPGSSEGLLIKLQNEYDQSVFKESKINMFLNHREREINTIDYFMKLVKKDNKKLEIVDYASANDISKIISKKRGVIFSLNIIQPTDVVENYIKGNIVDEKDMWLNDDQILHKVAVQFRDFTPYALANDNIGDDTAFLFKINKVENVPYEITAWNKTGKFGFTVPLKPNTPGIPLELIRHNQVSLRINKPNNKFVDEIEVLLVTYQCPLQHFNLINKFVVRFVYPKADLIMTD